MRSVVALVLLLVLVAAFLSPLPASAQIVERPVSLDTEGRMQSMTPAVAGRLGLGPPVWPVAGEYVEARMYERQEGGFVLIVTLRDGAMALYSMTPEERAALADAITQKAAEIGNLTTELRPDLISKPARGQFVRNQTVGAGLIYGPSLAMMGGGGAGSVALYWASVGTTFFLTAQISRNLNISKAQNHMTTDGMWKGALIGLGAIYLINEDPDEPGLLGAAMLMGSLSGSVLGYHAGRNLTDGEAHAATFGSTFATALTGGLLASAGAFEGGSDRPELAALMGASLAGYPLGLSYARRAGYSVTAGDVGVLYTTSVLGAAGAYGFIAGEHQEDENRARVVTAGLVAGAILGNGFFVKRYDFTESEAWLMRLGAVAGGLIGVAIPLGAETDNDKAYFGWGTAGAALGMVLTRKILGVGSGETSARPQ